MEAEASAALKALDTFTSMQTQKPGMLPVTVWAQEA